MLRVVNSRRRMAERGPGHVWSYLPTPPILIFLFTIPICEERFGLLVIAQHTGVARLVVSGERSKIEFTFVRLGIRHRDINGYYLG